MAPQEQRYGFVGLGDQGGPIARRIAGAGFPTMLWARRAATLDAFADTGAACAESLLELGAACSVVGVCVYADADVDEVVDGAGGLLDGMRRGSILLIHSTAHPDLCHRLAGKAADREIALLDAPVSGGHDRATRGEMTVMVGGDRTAFEQIEPMLRSFATTIEWLGPVGSGQVAKLINNAVTTVNFSAALAGLDAGERLGVERAALARVMMAGSGSSFALDRMAAATIEGLRFGLPRLEKDVSLMRDILAKQPNQEMTDALIAMGLEVFARYAGAIPAPV